MIAYRWPYEIDKARFGFAGRIRVKRHGWSGAMAGFDDRGIEVFKRYRAMPHSTRDDMPNHPAQV